MVQHVEVFVEAGEGFEGDDDETGAYGEVDGEAAEEDEGGDDEEAAAYADETGEETYGQAVEGDFPGSAGWGGLLGEGGGF